MLPKKVGSKLFVVHLFIPFEIKQNSFQQAQTGYIWVSHETPFGFCWRDAHNIKNKFHYFSKKLKNILKKWIANIVYQNFNPTFHIKN